MSSREHYYGRKEEPIPDPLVERLDRVRDEVIIRGGRWLNPLDPNPYLAQLPYERRSENGSHFSGALGIHDARDAIAQERYEPGLVEAEALSLAEYGAEMLEKFIAEHGQEAIDTNDLFSGIPQITESKSWATKQSLRQPMGLLHRVIKEGLWEVSEEGTLDDMKALFVSAVAFLQVKAVQHFDPPKKVRRRTIRNEAAMYGLRVLNNSDQRGLADYFIAQKAWREQEVPRSLYKE